jgi:hypothetical protein
MDLEHWWRERFHVVTAIVAGASPHTASAVAH